MSVVDAQRTLAAVVIMLLELSLTKHTERITRHTRDCELQPVFHYHRPENSHLEITGRIVEGPKSGFLANEDQLRCRKTTLRMGREAGNKNMKKKIDLRLQEMYNASDLIVVEGSHLVCHRKEVCKI